MYILIVLQYIDVIICVPTLKEWSANATSWFVAIAASGSTQKTAHNI